jgi:hypothetical protein
MSTLLFVPAVTWPLSWQIVLGIAVIALLWGATCRTPELANPARFVIFYNLASMCAWPALACVLLVPGWHVAEPLAAALAVFCGVLVRELRAAWLPLDDDDDEDDDDEDDDGPDLNHPPGGGHGVNWQRFEREAYAAWREHDATVLV